MVIIHNSEPINLEEAKSKIHEMVDEFLVEHLDSDDDGWPEVSNKDLHFLSFIIADLVEAKWSIECNGSRVIDYNLFDRNKGNFPDYESVPYYHKDLTGALEVALRNLRTATSDVETLMAIIQHREAKIVFKETSSDHQNTQ